jgi:HEAT repeat protein
LLPLVFFPSKGYNDRMKVRILNTTPGLLFMAVLLIAVFPRLHASAGPLDREPVYNGKPLHEWVIDTQDQNPDYSPTALAIEGTKAVQAIGLEAAVPWLVKWIKSAPNDSRLPEGAVNCFKIFGSRADVAVPDLTAIINLPAQSFQITRARMDAAEALGYLGPKAVPALLSAVTNPSLESLRLQFLVGLGNCSSNCPEVIPPLLQWAHDPDEATRLTALTALSHATRQPDLVVPILLRAALNETNGVFRDMMAEALGSFGKAASNAVPELIKLLDDPEATRGAILGMGKIGEPPDVIFPLLLKKLHDPDWRIRRTAAIALGDFGGQHAFKELMPMTDDSEIRIREAVFQSLKKIDPEQLKQSGKHL